MKLNYREKIILSVLLVIVIGVLGFFLLIKPKNEDIKNDTTARDAAQATWDEIYSRISQIPKLQESIANTVSDSKTVTDHFVEPEKIENPRKLDQFMQKYANDCDVKVSNLSVSAISETPISYYYKTAESASSLMIAADINGDMVNKKNEENAPSVYVANRSTGSALAGQYGITVTGTKENIWKYMQTIEKLDAVYINSVAISDYEFTDGLTEDQLTAIAEAKEKDEEYEFKDNEEPGESSVSFVITIYSLYEMPEANTQ